MLSFQAILVSLALGALTHAITVKEPDMSTVWQSGTSGQTVSWQAVSTDPTSFIIQLVNQQGFLQNGPVTLVQSQNTGSANQVNSATVTYPSGPWPIGTAFQINLMSTSMSNAAILAQSSQFNITAGGSSSSTTSSTSTTTMTGLAPTTMTNMAIASGASSSSASGTSSAGTDTASGGIIPNAQTSSHGAASARLSDPGAFIGTLISLAGLVGVMI